MTDHIWASLCENGTYYIDMQTGKAQASLCSRTWAFPVHSHKNRELVEASQTFMRVIQ